MSKFYWSYEQASKAASKLKIKSAGEYQKRYVEKENDEPSLKTDAKNAEKKS